MIKKLKKFICPINENTFNVFALTGEFQRFRTEEKEEFSFNLKKKIPIKSNWELVLSKFQSNKNEYNIPDLVYLFLRRKAFETLMRLKAISGRTKKDFNLLVESVKIK